MFWCGKCVPAFWVVGKDAESNKMALLPLPSQSWWNHFNRTLASLDHHCKSLPCKFVGQ
jgi:hypothetical protein